MNRVITDDDRLRRAEVIAERRKNFEIYDESGKENESKNGIRKRKLLIQILVCLCIYCGLYYIKNTQNSNSIEIIANIKSVLEYDINFGCIYNSIKEKINWTVDRNNDEINKEEKNDDSDFDVDNKEENIQENIISQVIRYSVGIVG